MPLAGSDRDELAAWLRLLATPGVGPVHARQLLQQFGPPQTIFETGRAALARVAGEPLAAAIRAADPARDAQVESALQWAEAPGHHLVTLADADYPAPLLQIGDPPPLLYVVGRRDALTRPMVAVVGSRNATAAGMGNARAFARSLSGAGFTLVSGLAIGIDAAAHEGSLAAGAATVAVMGTGADIVYPAAHRDLARRISADGALVSELPLGTRPSTGGFPRRNRLIAGLARGVLVVEAAVQSGSLITARLAAEFGREVFAIPGSIHSPVARGCHALIKQGAKLVDGAEDVLSELGVAVSATAHSDYSDRPVGHSDPVLAAIGHGPVLPETLAAHLGLSVAELSARLLELELAGSIQRGADGRITRTPPIG